MRIQDLALKSVKDVVTVRPDAAVTDVVQLLNEHKIGALPVCGSTGDLVGIVSERDIIRALSKSNPSFGDLRVSDLMTFNVATCSMDDKVEEVMAVMDRRSIRHVPVVADGRLVTILSSRDILAALLRESTSRVTTMTMAYEMVR